jgi:hypothetical protein
MSLIHEHEITELAIIVKERQIRLRTHIQTKLIPNSPR